MHALKTKETIRSDGYYDQILDTHLVSVMAGTFHWSRSDDIAFSTTLGSCLSVCAYDQHEKIGGINHFLLPQAPSHEDEKYSDSFRYGSAAIETLLNALYKNGAAKNGLTIKIFGGGKVLNKVSQDIGQKNINFAKNFFTREQMRIKTDETGGTQGQRIIFYPTTGKVLQKMINNTSELEKIAQNECKAINRLAIQKNKMTLNSSKLKIGIVDDSPLIRHMINAIIEEEENMCVVGSAANPIDARQMIKQTNPDIITLDIEMPHMDGIEFLEKIMRLRPMPVLMVSTLTQKGADATLRALEIGAIDTIAKPINLNHSDLLSAFKKELIPKLNTAKKSKFYRLPNITTKAQQNKNISKKSNYDLITIASSTGGIERLRYIFSQIKIHTPPIIVVQHINERFTSSMVSRMQQIVPNHIRVKLANHKDALEKNTIYIAQNTHHITVKQTQNDLYIHHINADALNGFKASADYLFKSAAQCDQKNILGLILSGMGHDGAKGLLDMKNNNMDTIGESSESCLVYGMPKAAAKLNALKKELTITQIAETFF